MKLINFLMEVIPKFDLPNILTSTEYFFTNFQKNDESIKMALESLKNELVVDEKSQAIAEILEEMKEKARIVSPLTDDPNDYLSYWLERDEVH